MKFTVGSLFLNHILPNSERRLSSLLSGLNSLSSHTPFSFLSASCCEGFLSDRVRGCGTSPSLLANFPSFSVWTHCCCWDTHTTGGQTWMSLFILLLILSHFLLLFFLMSNHPASSFCFTAHLPPSLAFPLSTSLPPRPPPYLSPPSFLTSSCPPLSMCRKH